MQRPLISIIITILNGGKTLMQCLNSIACQSFTNYEVVLIDGGSTDNTIDIIDASSIHNKTTRIVPGIGLYAGLNIGIDVARGDWLYFIGCDDLLFSSSTLYTVSKSIKTGSARIFAGTVEYKNGFEMAPRLGSPYFMRYALHHQGTFYHRSLFNQYRYNEKLFIASDYELNIILRLNNIGCEVINNTIAFYGDGGLSSIQYKKNFAEVREVNRRLFTGTIGYIAIIYCWIKQSIWLSRRRVGLLNLKHRLKIKSTFRKDRRDEGGVLQLKKSVYQ